MNNQQNITLPDKQPTIRVKAMPSDTNPSGTIFGGWIMSQADMAGCIAAQRHAKNRVVTVAVNAFEFRQPVYVGDVISCYCEITQVGRSSIVMKIDVYAERELTDNLDVIKVTEAVFTFVALDEHNKPCLIRQNI